MFTNIGTQSLEDKLFAFKYFIAGQDMSFIILKATTTEMIGPKRKHLNYLVNLTNEPNVSIPMLVKHMMQRLNNPEWTISFKVMITMHHLTSYGNEKFIQNLASSIEYNKTFDKLSSFVDCSSTLGFDMSTFVRRYSKYVRVKIQTYRSLGTDFCQVNRPQMKNMVKTPYEHLVKVVPILQNQFDALLAFDPLDRDLNNGIINSAFAILFRDFVKLYIAYQAAIIRLLELYFASNQVKQVRQLREIYKKFLVRMDKVCDFMRVVDAIGMDKSDLPNLSRIPNFPVAQLDQYLSRLEVAANKRATYQSIGQICSIEMPRMDYGTIGRRRSLKSPPVPEHQSLASSILSPVALRQTNRASEKLDKVSEEMPLDKRNSSICDTQTSYLTDTISYPKLELTDVTEFSGASKGEMKQNCDNKGNPEGDKLKQETSNNGDNDRDLLLWFESKSNTNEDLAKHSKWIVEETNNPRTINWLE